MTHLIFTQLLVDERRAALLADARLVRARAVAAPGPSRRSATRSGPIVGTAMLVAMLMGGCASIKAGAPATVAVQSAAPTTSTAAAPSAVPSTVPSVQPVPPT